MSEPTPYIITPYLAAPFRQFAHTVEEFLGDGEGLLAQVPEDDPEMAEIWQESLREGLHEDCQRILALVRAPEFGEIDIALTEVQVDALLRACSAIRLKLYRLHLAKVGDEMLECGEVDMDALDEQQERAYMIYIFLANLQAVLVDQVI